MEQLQSWLDETAPASNLGELLSKAFPAWPSLEAQHDFASLLCDWKTRPLPPCSSSGGEAGEQYAYPPKYLRSVLQCAKKSIEGGSDAAPDYDDDFMALLVDATCNGEVDPEDSGFSFYKCLHSERLVPVEIKRVHNQVGTKMWTAGLFLTELVQRMSPHWADKAVLELGAGVGLTGLMLARGLPAAQQPQRVVLTDYPADVMELLEKNASRVRDWNQNDAHSADEQDTCDLLTATVDWTEVQESGFPHIDLSAMDCILAADCTYSEDLNAAIMRLFEVYFSLAKTSHQMDSLAGLLADLHDSREEESGAEFLPCRLLRQGIPMVLIACTERNASTYNHFRSLTLHSDYCMSVEVSAQAQDMNRDPLYVPAFDRHLVKTLCIFPKPRE